MRRCFGTTIEGKEIDVSPGGKKKKRGKKNAEDDERKGVGAGIHSAEFSRRRGKGNVQKPVKRMLKNK